MGNSGGPVIIPGSEPVREEAAAGKLFESRSFRPWSEGKHPERVLIIRLQAIGDVAITLPACGALRRRYPAAHIAILTSEACRDIPTALYLFDSLFTLRQNGTRWQRALHALLLGARMRRERFDLIIDLQRHTRSRIVRHLASPKAWGEFDRYSPKPALERTLDTFQRAGIPALDPVYSLNLKQEIRERCYDLLRHQGWDGREKLVLLNPAGLWATRNWPLERYLELVDLWPKDEPVKFLFLGTGRLRERIRPIVQQLADRAIDLSCGTSLLEALGLLQHVSVAISEDSGLLHMAWVSGIPTVALLGSTRSDWTRPMGKHTRYVASEDLSCGACMQPVCRYGDVHCLSRYSADAILKLAQEAEKRE